jgi:hypothetical protein
MWVLRSFTVKNIYIFCKFSLVNLLAEIKYSTGTVDHTADIYFLRGKQEMEYHLEKSFQ